MCAPTCAPTCTHQDHGQSAPDRIRGTRARPSRRHVLALMGGTGLLAACSAEQLGGLNLVPERQVDQMGAVQWRQILAQQPVSRDPEANAVVRRIAARIVRAAGGDPGNWEVAVFEDRSPNAFALPGGKIGVHTGLMRLAENEDQLASVIGHEVGHVVAEHSKERVNAQAATKIGSQIAGVALGAAGLPAGPEMAALLGAGAQYGLILPFSRNHELEADRLGIEYMARAGYDPNAAVEFWRRMTAATQRQGRPPEWMSTHPSDERRIAQLEELAEQAEALRPNRRR